MNVLIIDRPNTFELLLLALLQSQLVFMYIMCVPQCLYTIHNVLEIHGLGIVCSMVTLRRVLILLVLPMDLHSCKIWIIWCIACKDNANF